MKLRLDICHVIASFMAVAIHTGPLSYYSGTADYYLTYCISRIGVPFFYMVTGYFVLSGYREKNYNPGCILSRLWTLRNGKEKKVTDCKAQKRRAWIELNWKNLEHNVAFFRGILPESFSLWRKELP